LIGENHGWLGQSVYLRDICGREEGAPPPVDLAAEKTQRLRGARHDPRRHRDRSAMTFPMAGLLIALAEMAIGERNRRAVARRARVDRAACLLVWRGSGALRRYPCRPSKAGLVLAKMKGAGVPCARIGYHRRRRHCHCRGEAGFWWRR